MGGVKMIRLGAGKCAAILRHEDQGASAVEYGLLLALIAIAIAGGVTLFGQAISQMFATITAGL